MFKQASRGLTLIEVLVVVLILGILLAVAIPLYMRSVQSAAENTCRANLTTLANVANGFRTSDPSHKFPDAAGLDAQLQKEGQPKLADFKGPNGESYTYTPSSAGDSFTIKCNNNPSHGTYDSTTGSIK
jgi:type IV pilus assembly protein PilA